MKSINLIYFLFFLSIQLVEAQPSQLQWTKLFGDFGAESAIILKPVTDGGYIGTGNNYSPPNNPIIYNNGYSDIWVIRLDSLYNKVWTKSFGSTGLDEAYNVFPQPDSTFIVTALASKKDADFAGISDENLFIILKLDNDGNLISIIDVPENIIASGHIRKIIESPNGFIIAGKSNNAGGNLRLLKMDFYGNVIWNKEYGGSASDRATCINQASDGGYIIGGWSASTNGDIIVSYTDIPQADLQKSWLVKVDSLGNLMWEKRYFGHYIQDVIEANDGGYLFNAQTDDYPYTYFLTKVDSLRNIEWRLRTSYEHPSASAVFSIFQTSTNDFIIGHETTFGSWMQISSDGKIRSSPLEPSDHSHFDLSLATFNELSDGSYLAGMDRYYPFHLSKYSPSNSFTAADFDSLDMNTTKNIDLLANDIRQIGDSLVINSIFDQGLNFHSITNTISILNDSVVQYIPSQGFAFYDIFKYEVIKYNNHIEIARDTNIVLVYVEPPVSISKLEIEKQNAIKVFPQPVQTQFTVTLKDKSQKIKSLHLYNSNMQMIKDFGNSPNHQKNCDINNLPSGSYFIIVNETFAEKLIKL